MQTDLKSMNIEEMTAFLGELGEPSFRGKQIFRWLHRGVTSFEEMSDLSKGLRERLSQSCFITAPQWSGSRSQSWMGQSSIFGISGTGIVWRQF